MIEFVLFFLSSFLSFSYFIEQKTLSGLDTAPDTPSFTWTQLPTDNGNSAIRVNWLPAMETGRSGSHFFVKYRQKGQTTWMSTSDVLEDDFVVVRGLEPEETYEFRVVSVDGEFKTESKIQDVVTYGIGMFINVVMRHRIFESA